MPPTTPRNIIVILLLAVLALTMGCTGNGSLPFGEGGGRGYVPQDNDTLYTEQKAMSIHRTEPERALVMIDSAVIVGNITPQRGEYIGADGKSRRGRRTFAYCYRGTAAGEYVRSVHGLPEHLQKAASYLD